MGKLTGLVQELQRPAEPREAKNYYPTYPGFKDLFRIPITPQNDRLVIELPDNLDDYAKRGAKVDLAKILSTALRSSDQFAAVSMPP